jgi:UDPglucose 6-dehydrogenase
VVLLLTEWPGFTALMPDSLEGTIARHNIIDARSVLGPGPRREAGWEFRALGVAEEAAPAGRLDSSRG